MVYMKLIIEILSKVNIFDFLNIRICNESLSKTSLSPMFRAARKSHSVVINHQNNKTLFSASLFSSDWNDRIYFRLRIVSECV